MARGVQVFWVSGPTIRLQMTDERLQESKSSERRISDPTDKETREDKTHQLGHAAWGPDGAGG